MKERKLAVSASKQVLEKVGEVTGIIVKEMIGPVADAIKTYGCRNEIKIIEEVKVLAPEFEKLSEKFFDVLYQTIEISQKTKQRNFEIILNAIFSDENASIEVKVDLVNKLLAEKGKNNAEITKTVTKGAAGTFVASLIVVKGSSLVKSLAQQHSAVTIKKISQEAKTERLKIAMDGIANIVGKFSPAEQLKAFGELIHKK